MQPLVEEILEIAKSKDERVRTEGLFGPQKRHPPGSPAYPFAPHSPG